MANEHAVPEETQEKTHGDKRDGALSKGKVPAQEPSTTSERKPAEEPLK